MSLVEVHSAFSWTTLIFFGLMGVWGLIRALRKYRVDGSFMGAMAIGEGLFILQAVLGLILVITGARPGRTIHFLYGVFALVALPGLFAYLKGEDDNQAQWYYAIAILFLAGVSLRAISTGA